MRRITNVCLPQTLGASSEENRWWLLVNAEDQVIDLQVMGEDLEISGENWGGDFISPMGLDLQINGGLGVFFSEMDISDLHLCWICSIGFG